MNRIISCLFLLLPTTATLVATGQTVPAPIAASRADVVTETGKVSRFVAGPGDRPQGLLLHNGTFVSLSPGLSQQLPASLQKGVSVQVAGNISMYEGSRTIEAHDITIAGVVYTEAPPQAAGAPVPLPPLPVATGPAVGGPVTPPPPCGIKTPQPPPPPAPGADVPPPPQDTASPAPSPQARQ